LGRYTGPYSLQTEQLSQVRESLVGAETSKVHLQERIDQLTRQLQGNEEKLAVYERHPSAANGATPATEQDLPREQQLEQEVAELWLVSKYYVCGNMLNISILGLL
jgi:transcription initiation factor IIF auxiliary subunit